MSLGLGTMCVLISINFRLPALFSLAPPLQRRHPREPVLFDVAPVDRFDGAALTGIAEKQSWSHVHKLNAMVTNVIVDLWGSAQSETERQAIRWQPNPFPA